MKNPGRTDRKEIGRFLGTEKEKKESVLLLRRKTAGEGRDVL